MWDIFRPATCNLVTFDSNVTTNQSKYSNIYEGDKLAGCRSKSISFIFPKYFLRWSNMTTNNICEIFLDLQPATLSPLIVTWPPVNHIYSNNICEIFLDLQPATLSPLIVTWPPVNHIYSNNICEIFLDLQPATLSSLIVTWPPVNLNIFQLKYVRYF